MKVNNYQFALIDFPGWLLIKERAYCTTDISSSREPTVNHCAKACKGVSTFFAVGTTDHGETNCAGSSCCTSQGCVCYCEDGSGGSCQPITGNGYNAYEYSDEKERKYTDTN